MMIFKLMFMCALIGAPVLGSAIKGHPAHEEAAKGGRQLLAPVVHQRLVEQTKSTVQKLEHVAVEQRREEQQQLQQAPIAEQKLEESPSKTRYEQKQEELQTVQQKEELPARLEETKGQQKHEVKTLASREELAKGQQKYEQRQEVVVAVEQKQELSKSTKHEQKQEESKTRYEQKQEELPSKTRYEQKQDELKQEVVAVEQQKVELSKTNYEQKQEERYEQQQRDYDQQIELKEEQRHYEEQSAFVQQEEVQQQQIQQEATKGGQAPLAEAEPYAFSYQVEGSSRSESGDTKGTVRGQYTVQGADGSSRVVDYIADHNGFRASVNTNEFGTEAKSPANIALRTSQPLAEEITLRLEGKTREDLAAPAAPAAVKGAVPAKPQNWQVKDTAPGQLPLPQFEESPKGAAVKKTAVFHEEILRTQPIAAAGAPAKGQRLVQEEASQQQELLQTHQQPEPIKSAELRAPKSISGDFKLGQARAGFESATAHRIHRTQPAAVVASVAPVQLRPVVPGVIVRAQPPPVPDRLPVPAVSRTYLQRERYPPSPVQQAGYRRELSIQTNPRVSFYAPASASVQSVSSSASFDDDQPSSFEHSDSQAA